MPVNALSIARDGIGYGSLAVATDGFISIQVILLPNYLGGVTTVLLIKSNETTFIYPVAMSTTIELIKPIKTTLEIGKSIQTKIESIEACLTTFELIKGSETVIWQA